MIETISIRNFRSFKAGEIGQCARINVIVGGNGCGKTSLLEGIFLASGISPELAVRTRGWRGLDVHVTGDTNDIWDALFSDLFHLFDTNKPATISLTGDGSENRSFSVQIKKSALLPPARNRPGEPPRLITFKSPIQFLYKLKGEKEEIVEPALQKDEIVFPPIRWEPLKMSFFASNRTPPHMESAKQFSKLSKSFESDEFISTFSRIYKNIKSISIELSGGTPMLFAEVAGIPRKIPLAVASGGMNKLVAILLAMSQQAGGVVLVDELENGFYYSHLPVIWEALLAYSKKYNCQLFISTHSYECLQSASAVAHSSPEDFCILRASLKNGETSITKFGGRQFSDAIEENIEIR